MAIPQIKLIHLFLFWFLLFENAGTSYAQDTFKGFDKSVQTFLVKHCTVCHGAEKPKAKLRVDDLIGKQFDAADHKRWQNILEMVDLGEMPPPQQPQPTEHERAEFMKSLNQQLSLMNVGKNVWEKELPRYANRVDHNALFSGEHEGPAYTPARVWRISGDTYQRLMKDFELGFDFVVPLQKNEEGFFDYARLYADEATIRTMKQNAKRVATALIKGKPTRRKRNEDPNKHVVGYQGSRHKAIKRFLQIQGEPNHDQMKDVMAFIFQFITKLEPTDLQIDRWVEQVLVPNIRAGGNEAGLHGTIVAVLLSPEFLFRVETGLGKKLPDGRRMLSSTELAFALSYTLHNHPVKTLLEAAKQGKLKTRADVEREFRALYANPELLRGRTAAGAKNNIWQSSKDHRRGTYSRPKLVQFFQQYFGYTRAPDIFKDDLRHGGKHRPDNLIKDADWTVLHILAKDKNVLEELLTTNRFALPKGKTSKKKSKKKDGSNVSDEMRLEGYLAAYNLTTAPTVDRAIEMTEMPEGQRAGMLTHPAWLVAHSTNFHTDPVRRGKWILGHLLGYDVPELPIAVQAQLPEWHDKTIRERFSVVRAVDCWRCHKKMNPLGEVFEAYDDFGRFRTKHLVGTNGHIVETEFEKQNRFNPKSVTSAQFKIPVDMGGELFGTGDPKLDGTVNDPVDLMHRLAKSKRVRQVFFRHMFRYWMGRNETLNDSPTLMAMDKAYVDSGGSFKETLVALITSDSFLFRK